MASNSGFPHMTLRVYTVTPEGQITSDSGVRPIMASERPNYSSKLPPCECPHHRPDRARKVRT